MLMTRKVAKVRWIRRLDIRWAQSNRLLKKAALAETTQMLKLGMLGE